MKKALKKITTTAMAAILAMGTMGAVGFANASTPVSEYTWAVQYYDHPGTGTYTGTKDSCYMTYSPKGNKASCTEMKVTVDGATCTVGVRTVSSNVSFVYGQLKYVGDTVTLKPEPLTEVIGISYEFYGGTSVVGNTMTAKGSMKTVK